MVSTLCVYFHRNSEDDLLWYTLFGVGWVFQPPEVLLYLILKQGQLVGRLGPRQFIQETMRNLNGVFQAYESEKWCCRCHDSLLYPRSTYMVIGRVSVCCLMRHKLMLVDGSMVPDGELRFDTNSIRNEHIPSSALLKLIFTLGPSTMLWNCENFWHPFSDVRGISQKPYIFIYLSKIGCSSQNKMDLDTYIYIYIYMLWF